MAGTSVSALLRTAATAASKQTTLNDDLAAQKFANSAQTADDYQEYATYLRGRISSTTNPITVVGLQNKATAAFSAFSSNEIQRSAIDVLEGNGTLEDKQNTIIGLYNRASSIGDDNLSQNLRQQYDSLNIQIQNQRQTVASEMSANNVTNLKDLADSYINGDDPNQAKTNPSNAQLVQLFKTQGADAVDKLFTSPDGKTQYSMWDMIYSNIYHSVAALQLAAQSSSSQSEANTLYQQAARIQDGTTTYNIAGISVSVNDVINAADAARNGQILYQPVKDSNGDTTLKQNKITDYVWARDMQGNYRIVQTRNELSSLVTETQDPNTPGQLTQLGTQLKAKLKQAGYDVIGVDSTSGLIRVRQTTAAPGGKDATNIPGTAVGESFEVAYDPTSGDVRLESSASNPNDPTTKQIFGISLHGDKGNNTDFGQIYKVSATGDTFFSDPAINSVGSFNAASVPKLLSAAALQGTNGPGVDLQNDSSTTSLFANAATRQANMERIAAATTASIQGSSVGVQNSNPGFDIQAMQVPAGARLTVSNMPAPGPISIAKPTPLPNVSVSTAPNTQTIQQPAKGGPTGSLQVNNQPNTQTIKV